MEKVLKSGTTMTITPADFAAANALRKSLMKSLKGIPLGPEMLQQDVSVLADLFAQVGTSDEVERDVFACGQKALYGERKFDRALFDDPTVGEQARKDFLEACWNIVQVNVLPFFDHPLSLLKTLTASKTENQK